MSWLADHGYFLLHWLDSFILLVTVQPLSHERVVGEINTLFLAITGFAEEQGCGTKVKGALECGGFQR